MIDNEELLVAIVGESKVATFKEVKLTSMRLARVVREVIAEDLQGTLPATGKQFLTTRRGLFRLASRPNSDNTTEQLAHTRMGARTVQVFGDISTIHHSRGWMTVEELYRLHRIDFDAPTMLNKVATRFRASS
jgi:hypothetical protein